ncbi:hypothetical protein COCSADRAFT_222376 [Bipolaris sorokiniana ND90Pr]|uniref:Uncharacterized protein n=1 Tax=Cochliobolus sativus (strain ND90Pr / ATCC 201652) TaxID=665912 RepID=M2R615_COCSN|nr:uncharacterized protein COCSADRAFT_222376 [Bipolaris sorokiniana ND90Pr]EMD62584.1 hypothetical protein COCSADRAFT_222376 [Bipolaris sorokiniana ND90Pr]
MITHPSSAATNTRHHSSPPPRLSSPKPTRVVVSLWSAFWSCPHICRPAPPPSSRSWAHVPSARLIFASPGAIPPPPISRSLFLSADSPHIA